MSNLTPAAEAAAELVAGAARLAEAPIEGEQPAPEVEAVPDLPSLEADLSGIEDILEDVPDDEDDDEPLPVGDIQIEEEYDPDKLRAQVKKLEKQNKFLEEQRVTQGRKNWKAEAERRFPLADVDDITATSRRGFLKAAAESHDRTHRRLKPILDQLKQAETEEQEAARVEQRGVEAQQWGRPTAGPQQPLVEQAETTLTKQQALDRSRHPDVKSMVRSRFKHDDNFKNGI